MIFLSEIEKCSFLVPDGLFDNINDSMILAELNQLPNDLDDVCRSDLERVAQSLAKLARRKAIDKSFLSVSFTYS